MQRKPSYICRKFENMRFADLDLNKMYTYADYFAWDIEERVELIKGKIFKMAPAPNLLHQVITRKLTIVLGVFLEKKPCQLFAAPFDVRFPTKSKKDEDIITILQPDLCVVCDPTKLDSRGCNGAPDIVVEVLSPGNTAREMNKKYEIYETAGVKEYWIVSPLYETILVYTLHNNQFVCGRPLATGDSLVSSLLPGFSLDLGELFLEK
jgi:Uma2 family endonuclease